MSIPGAETVEVPVLIVGAGPAGLALSVALSRYGVGHLVIERHVYPKHIGQAKSVALLAPLRLHRRVFRCHQPSARLNKSTDLVDLIITECILIR